MLFEKAAQPSASPVCVVRVRTSTFQTDRGLSIRKDLTTMRKLSTPGYDILETEIDATGADETARNITNLDSVEDGLYILAIHNVHHDWETGHVDDYSLKLVPYKKS